MSSPNSVRPVRRAKTAVITLFAALVVALLAGGLFVRGEARAIREAQREELAPVAYVGSDSCKECHPAEHASGSESHHHKMTQTATPAAVVGDFNNATYTFNGVTSKMYRRGDEFFMETLDPNGKLAVAKIVRTIGSRRFQQYVTQVGDTFYRLPVAWNIEKKYWFNLQGLFLEPDSPNFSRHTSVWNNNCIFCHNVKGNPGMDLATGRFPGTRVEELGIGCEACHGPGARHIEMNKKIGWTWLRKQVRPDDPTIVHPKKGGDSTRNLQVCGHCHGQRMPKELDSIRTIMAKGDPFTPGEDLSKYYKPLAIGDKVGTYDFSPRFYPDGTPRLTAYEYQGVLMSKCHQGGMTCTSCHDVHKGRQQSLMLDNMRGNDSCTQCHAPIAANIEVHTHHPASSSGSNCYECHRPRISFGLLTAKRTHRILNPNPDKSLSTEMPNGCTLCHQSKSATWAADAMVKWYGQKYALTPANAARPEAKQSELVRELFSGDPSARIAAAWGLGQYGENKNRDDGLWTVPFLVEALRDPYPAVRYFAYDSLRQVTGESSIQFFYLADPKERETGIARWSDWWKNHKKTGAPPASVPLDAAWTIPSPDLAAFRKRVAGSLTIEIGE